MSCLEEDPAAARNLAALACALVVPVALPAAAPAKPAKKDPSVALQQAVTVQGMLRHERALAEHRRAQRRHPRLRYAGLRPVARLRRRPLRTPATTVTVQPFDFPFFQQIGPATLERTGAAKLHTEGPGNDFNVMHTPAAAT